MRLLQLVMLVLLVALLPGCAGTQPATLTPTAKPATAPQKAAATEVPTPTTAKGNLGERITLPGRALTVNAVATVTDLRGHSTIDVPQPAKQGQLFLLLDLTLENTATKGTIWAQVGDFRLKDKDARLYESSPAPIRNKLGNTQLSAGEKVRGYLCFEVSSGQDAFTLVYQPLDKPLVSASVSIPLSAATATVPTPSDSSNRAQVVTDYLKTNFGMPGYETSWFKLMREVQTQGDTVTVSTDIFPDAEGKQFASGICSAVSGLIYAKGNEHLGLSQIVVRAKDGQVLIRRTGMGDRCS